MATRIHKRLNTILQVTTLAAAMAAASVASAAPGHDRHAASHRSSNSGNQGYYAWVDVVDVDPIVRTDYIDEPVERCWETRSNDRRSASWHDDDRRRRDDRRDRANPGAVLLGGALGGLVGNQFGGGNGKKALTVVGAVLGASIAAEASRSSARGSRDYRDTRWRDEPVRRCEVTYESRPVERISAYEVTYRYHGRRFTKVVEDHPGDRMRVRVDVQPVV